MEKCLAFVLGGGGACGAMQVGALRALDEHSAIHSIDVDMSGEGYFLLWIVMGFPARKVEYADGELKDRFGVDVPFVRLNV